MPLLLPLLLLPIPSVAFFNTAAQSSLHECSYARPAIPSSIAHVIKAHSNVLQQGTPTPAWRRKWQSPPLKQVCKCVAAANSGITAAQLLAGVVLVEDTSSVWSRTSTGIRGGYCLTKGDIYHIDWSYDSLGVRLSSLQGMEGLVVKHRIDLDGSRLESVEALERVFCRELSLQHCKITSLGGIRGIAANKSVSWGIDLSSNEISSLEELDGMLNNTWLSLIVG